MLGRTFLKALFNHVSRVLFFIFFLHFLTGFCASAASQKESVTIDGKSFLIEMPDGLCDGSETGWGVAYEKFLLDLGIAASGNPTIVSVMADCNFVVSTKQDGLPNTWGYIAFDKTVGRYWFGQKSLNKRMRKEIESIELETTDVDVKRITNNSLKKVKSNLSIGEIVRLGKPIQNDEGFLVSAVARLASGDELLDVYLTTVTFIRNRQIITFAIYQRAVNELNLDQVRSIGKQFLMSLSVP